MRRIWPPIVATALYWVSVAMLVWQSMQLNQGHLAYPLDDPYIHMAMAKNVALHGVWGVTRHEFSSTSSSPLWTALLAVTYKLFGVGESIPLWFNLLAGTLSIWVAAVALWRRQLSSSWICGVLAVLVFGSALPTLTVTGMEHTMHGLLTLAFAVVALEVITNDKAARSHWLLAGLAAGLATTRYEGLFTIAAVVLLLLFTRRLLLAGMVTVAAFTPIVAFGVWSMAHGWYFLPNSVVLKGNVPQPGLLSVAKLLAGWQAINALQLVPHLLVLLAGSLVVVVVPSAPRVTRPTVVLTTIFVVAAVLHLQFAQTGWFYRYEAYLLMLGIVVVGITIKPWVDDVRARHGRDVVWLSAAMLLVAIAATPIAVRGFRALQSAPRLMKITYDQQVQMGRFLDTYYTGRTVAMNDIGAMNYFADIKVVDLVGLASMDVARLRRSREQRAWIESLVGDRADIAIVYDSWLIQNGGVPKSWHKVGEWTGAVPDSTVAFYAIRDDRVTELRDNLRDFLVELPPDVVASGEFVE